MSSFRARPVRTIETAGRAPRLCMSFAAPGSHRLVIAGEDGERDPVELVGVGPDELAATTAVTLAPGRVACSVLLACSARWPRARASPPTASQMLGLDRRRARRAGARRLRRRQAQPRGDRQAARPAGTADRSRDCSGPVGIAGRVDVAPRWAGDRASHRQSAGGGGRVLRGARPAHHRSALERTLAGKKRAVTARGRTVTAAGKSFQLRLCAYRCPPARMPKHLLAARLGRRVRARLQQAAVR